MRGKMMKKAILAAAAALTLTSTGALAAGKTFHVSGQGTIEEGRHFNLSATVTPNGVRGHATLIIKGDSGAPYIAQIDISCLKQTGAEVYLGGTVISTNEPDPVYSDAVFFAVSSGGDKLSRAYFWDDQPAITGDPAACQGNVAGDFPLENVIRGNINVSG
jgi:hypothetical protein